MNKGVIKFHVTVCDACKQAKHEHVGLDGQFLLFAEYRMVRTVLAGHCAGRPVGDCALCGKRAEELGVAAERHMDLITAPARLIENLDGSKTPAGTPTVKSVCGHCVTKLAVTFTDPANHAGIQELIDACATKIVRPDVPLPDNIPAGAAKVMAFPKGN
jgi:hypothetical protein